MASVLDADHLGFVQLYDWEEDMEQYLRVLRTKHARTITGSACTRYAPRAAEKGDHVAVYCESCGVLLHRNANGR